MHTILDTLFVDSWKCFFCVFLALSIGSFLLVDKHSWRTALKVHICWVICYNSVIQCLPVLYQMQFSSSSAWHQLLYVTLSFIMHLKFIMHHVFICSEFVHFYVNPACHGCNTKCLFNVFALPYTLAYKPICMHRMIMHSHKLSSLHCKKFQGLQKLENVNEKLKRMLFQLVTTRNNRLV